MMMVMNCLSKAYLDTSIEIPIEAGILVHRGLGVLLPLNNGHQHSITRVLNFFLKKKNANPQHIHMT